MPWNRDGYQDYAKEVVQMAKDNGVYFNQAHAPFIFHTSYLPDWNREILPMQIRCMEACALLGIPHMVVHPVHHPALSPPGRAGEEQRGHHLGFEPGVLPPAPALCQAVRRKDVPGEYVRRGPAPGLSGARHVL